jgi:uncharacterized YigZ family protein
MTSTPPSDRFLRIAVESVAEIKVKDSRFIAESCRVTAVDEAQARLNQIRRREHAASHHCYAWRVGLGDQARFKYSDDGEPGGTAGRPIYDAIMSADLTDVLLVVTRYFGGTKLGTGGLARAYAEAARQVLAQSGRTECFLNRLLRVTIDYSLYEQLMRLMRQYHTHQVRSDLTSDVCLELEIRRGHLEEFIADLIELSAGKARIEELPT